MHFFKQTSSWIQTKDGKRKREGRREINWKKKRTTNDDAFRGNNLTRSFLHHWPRFYVRGSEHRPPVDFHTTEEWVMPNLHIACDFVFDVTRSLLIMQWTRCEYARTTRTRRWNSHLVFLPSFSPLYISLFLLIYLFFIYIFLRFSVQQWSNERRKRKLFFVSRKFERFFFLIFHSSPCFLLSFHFLCYLFINQWNWISLILSCIIYVWYIYFFV